MRARNIKPSFFKNELLATSDPHHALTFAGLWCLADREGRLEDRPRRIHLEVNPGRSFEVTEAALEWLNASGFILRYSAREKPFIQILRFKQHQYPHIKEPKSTIPAPDQNGASTVSARLNPSSLNPESPILNPESPTPSPLPSNGGSSTALLALGLSRNRSGKIQECVCDKKIKSGEAE